MIETSRAARRPVPKKRGSRTGFIVDPFRRREYVFESGLEEQWLSVLIADPRVRDLQEQLSPVRFIDRANVDRSHWFDTRHVCVGGRRIATAVKYEDDARRDDLAGILEAIAEQAFEVDSHGRTIPFADEYRIVTERHLDGVRVRNARKVVTCGCDHDFEAQAIVRRWLGTADRTFVLRTVGLSTGLGSRGYRAALALFQSGAIAVSGGVRIGPETMVVNHAFNPR